MVWAPTEGRGFGLTVIMLEGCNPGWQGAGVSSFLRWGAQGAQSIFCLFLSTLSLGGELGRVDGDGWGWLMGWTLGVVDVLWVKCGGCDVPAHLSFAEYPDRMAK